MTQIVYWLKSWMVILNSGSAVVVNSLNKTPLTFWVYYTTPPNSVKSTFTLLRFDLSTIEKEGHSLHGVFLTRYLPECRCDWQPVIKNKTITITKREDLLRINFKQLINIIADCFPLITYYKVNESPLDLWLLKSISNNNQEDSILRTVKYIT